MSHGALLGTHWPEVVFSAEPLLLSAFNGSSLQGSGCASPSLLAGLRSWGLWTE